MAEKVGSAIVQESVSRAVSLVLDKCEERASRGHTIEKLEMALEKLAFAKEMASELPIISVSLLCRRMKLKRAYEECGEMLERCKLRISEDEEAEQGVTHSSFPKRIIHTVKSSASYFISPGKDEFSLSTVRRMEWYGEEASSFVRDVESCFSLAQYRFFNPVITQLLQGESLWYTMVQGRRNHSIYMYPVRSEDHGIAVWLSFRSSDPKMPAKCFSILVMLRLSESMDIFGVAINCLQPFGPLKSLAQDAIGEISQLPAQDFARSRADHMVVSGPAALLSTLLTSVRPDPLCCRANKHRTCADDNVIPFELSCRFPEEAIYVNINCSISALGHNLQSSSADRAQQGNVANDDSPLLMWSARFFPHFVGMAGKMYALESIGEQDEYTDGTSLQQMEEMVLTNAVNCFIRRPEITKYEIYWMSPHGAALFIVRKPEEKVGRKPTTGPTTRRAAKLKRSRVLGVV